MYLFMTGYPGFIATRLVRELVKRGSYEKILLLVLADPEKKFLRQAEIEVRRDLTSLPIELIEGDISQPDLAIRDSKVLEMMTTKEGVWWHLAAIYRLDVPESVAKKVNVCGTREVLSLAKRCSGLRRLNYISTAYVSGDRPGKVLEEELWDGTRQRFKNFYESTKNEAEFLVRGIVKEIPVTTYRYGVVAGDSKTGETAKFDGPYFLMRFFSRWGKVPLPYVGPMESKFNMVPVDYIVAASAAIAGRADTVGKTFHLTDPDPVTSGDLYRLFADELGCPRPIGHLPPSVLKLVANFRFVRRLLSFPKEAVYYMNHGADYDCSQARKVLDEEGITCPKVKDYYKTLVKWYVANRKNKELHVPVD